MDALSILRHKPATKPRHVLVALHGVISHGGWFERVGEAFARLGIALHALDRRGSGQARGAEGRDDAEAIVADVVRAVEMAGDDAPVSLLGWCWGARPAIVAAARARVSKLVLAAPGLAMNAEVLRRADEALTRPGDDLVLPFDDEAFSDDPAVVRYIREDELRWRSQPRSFFATSRALQKRALELLPSLPMPVLTVTASTDRVVDNARLETIVGAHPIRRMTGGHALILERPDDFAAEIAGWL